MLLEIENVLSLFPEPMSDAIVPFSQEARLINCRASLRWRAKTRTNLTFDNHRRRFIVCVRIVTTKPFEPQPTGCYGGLFP